MHGSRAPLLIFVVAFSAFLSTFACLLLLLKPELEKRRAADDTQVTRAGVGPGTDQGQPPENPTDPPAPLVPFIEGLVTRDDKAPVAEATVYVLSAGPGNEAQTILAQTLSDAEGRFRIDLEEGQSPVTVVVVRDGFGRWRRLNARVQIDRPLKLDRVVLKKPETLRVAVRDEREAPIAGVRVEVDDPVQGPAQIVRPSAEGVTDSAGIARLPVLDFGQYHVSVTGEKYTSTERTLSLDAAMIRDGYDLTVRIVEATSWLRGHVVFLDGRRVTEGEVVARALDPALSSIPPFHGSLDPEGGFEIGPVPRGDYEIVAEITGIEQQDECYATADGPKTTVLVEYGGLAAGGVECLDGRPSDVTIGLTRKNAGQRFEPYVGSCRTTYDVATGTFRIQGLPPGTWQVRATSPGYAPARSEVFTLGPGQHFENLRVRLTSGGSIRGVVLDVRGKVLPGVRVTAYEGNKAPPPALAQLLAGTMRSSTESDGSGQFRLSGLSLGQQVLVFDVRGTPSRTLGPLDLQENVEIRLGRLVLGGGASISGTVSTPSGEPAPEAHALLESLDGSTWIPFQADRSGRFHLRGFAPGTYLLRTTIDGETSDMGSATRIQLGPQEQRNVDLTLR